VRLQGFSRALLEDVGRKVRDLYAEGADGRSRVLALADDAYVGQLASAVTGELGGKVGVVPRLFLKKLVAEVLDRIDQFADFDPRKDYRLTVAEAELTRQERSARAARDPDEIELPA